VPTWAPRSGFCSITRTDDELSLICAQEAVPADVRAERDRRLLGVDGPLDFGLVGVLAKLSTALANAGISIVAVSTFDTDYVLVREQDVQPALAALAAAGYVVTSKTL